MLYVSIRTARHLISRRFEHQQQRSITQFLTHWATSRLKCAGPAARRGTIALGLRTVAFSERTPLSLVKPNEQAN